jgi:hypothetical protein
MNVREYERLVSSGALDGRRFELLDGCLVEKQQKDPFHVWSVDATEVYTDPAEGGYRTRQEYPRGTQVPVILDGLEHGSLRVDDLLP